MWLFGQGCNHALKVARSAGEFRRFKLHHLVYNDLRSMGLSANLAVQAIARVGKRQGSKAGGFKADSAVYDQRTLSLKGESVSLTTTAGRLVVPMRLGNYQRGMLARAKSVQGGVLIRTKDGKWYVNLSLRFDDPAPIDPNGMLGVDMGIANIATDSDGEKFSGKHLNSVRHRHRRLRKKLQKKGTKGAKRRLKKLSGKERRFASITNHTIAKSIVTKAQRTGRGIAVEELTGIRSRVKARKPQRVTLHSWSFHDLGQKLLYKAKAAGVLLVSVDPRYTSQQCSCCGHTEKANRPNQSAFTCRVCGFADHADVNAARNISSRGAVNRPYLGEANRVSLHGSVPESPLL